MDDSFVLKAFAINAQRPTKSEVDLVEMQKSEREEINISIPIILASKLVWF